MTSTVDIQAALAQGGVVILPTETVYGIAARADNSAAIDRIYAMKGRDFDKPLAVCVRGLQHAKQIANFNSIAQELAEDFWPGPLTLVLPSGERALDPRCYQGNTIALRCPDIDWRVSLADTPLALTSANRSGEPDSLTADTDLPVDASLDGGPSRMGQPSTIIQVTDSGLKILRRGALDPAALAAYPLET